MALSITVWLREGRYDAAYSKDRMEWPPHPARLFCALVASAEHDPDAPGFEADGEALRWLEAAGAPLVLAAAADQVPASLRSGYVVTNARDGESGSTVWPGRTNRDFRRVGALPPDDRIAFVWPEASAPDGVLWRLSRLARRVPYVGRSTSSAQVEVLDETVDRRPSQVTYRPVTIGARGSVSVRVPYPGYLADLRDAYAQGHRAWEMSEELAYSCLPADDNASPFVGEPGPYEELLVWPAARGQVPVGGDALLTVTELLRRVAISRIKDPVPAQASGHGADDRPHLAFVPLLDVGHPHADGHLLGVGVAVPRDIEPDDRLAILRGLLGESGQDPIRELRGATQRIRLADPGVPSQGWGLDPYRWTSRDGVRRWVTATPVMLDRYPGRRDPAEVVAESLVTARYPEPASVTVLEGPLPQGAVTRPRRGTIPAGRDRRPLLHCRIEFPTPVRGPVIAGALRYLGCGLFIPEVSRADR
ncbi:type I-U CRISPR-associated protein Csb2 [Micromonospora sp. NPDC049230]|uniref:type I-G CRISPR-associated protein Csb2 n=1 Tax=Micromonospora sp. NPDC049230 TaxID=3155502 RepID=UPI0033CBEF84